MLSETKSSRSVIEEAPILSLTHSSSGLVVLLDIGGAVYLTPQFTSVYPSLTCDASTAYGSALSVSDQGELGPLRNVLISDTVQHNCVSISLQSDIGIMLYSQSLEVLYCS